MIRYEIMVAHFFVADFCHKKGFRLAANPMLAVRYLLSYRLVI